MEISIEYNRYDKDYIENIECKHSVFYKDIFLLSDGLSENGVSKFCQKTAKLCFGVDVINIDWEIPYIIISHNYDTNLSIIGDKQLNLIIYKNSIPIEFNIDGLIVNESYITINGFYEDDQLIEICKKLDELNINYNYNQLDLFIKIIKSNDLIFHLYENN